MNDSELLREAILLLALMERNHDAERGLIVISDVMWRDLTRNFRERMNAAMHSRLREPVR